MKRFSRILTVLLTVFMLMGSVMPVLAAGDWSEDYYRAVYSEGLLTEAERDTLDESCIEVVSTYGIDIAVMAEHTESYSGMTLSELGDYMYEKCEFGVGEDKDGIIVVYDADLNEMCINAYGKAAYFMTDGFKNKIIEASVNKLDEYGVWGVLYMPIATVRNYLESTGGAPDEPVADAEAAAASDPESADAASEAETAEAPAGITMPSWYPENPSDFQFFHDETAPRVVDEADIFTDEEEAEMAELIKGIQNDCKGDVVIYTSDTSYGLGETTLAMDFYDFNGYGIGDEYEGFCLCIVMDPNDRGFAVSATGIVTEGLYTQYNADRMDDSLYGYMSMGPDRYGDGVKEWIGNVRNLYTKGFAFTPSWYPDLDEEIIRTNNSESSRVTDETGQLTDEQITELDGRCRALSDQLGTDVALHVAESTYWMTDEEYAEGVYEAYGYGFGPSYDGVIGILHDTFDESHTFVYGNGPAKLGDPAISRLDRQAASVMSDSSVYDAADMWLTDMEHFARTGRIPRTKGYWLFITVISAIAGAATGKGTLGSARKAMAKPTMKRDARGYIVPGSLIVRKVSERRVSSRTTSFYSPPKTESSGGSSGGHSSYSSHSTGSSGRSHTTSGRKF